MTQMRMIRASAHKCGVESVNEKCPVCRSDNTLCQGTEPEKAEESTKAATESVPDPDADYQEGEEEDYLKDLEEDDGKPEEAVGARTMVQMSEKGPFSIHRGYWHREKYSLFSLTFYSMFDLCA